MNPKVNGNGWALQVVRGRDPGRVFALGSGEVVLGSAPGEPAGIDLAGQEGENALRKMAGRHASLDCSNGAPALRDLESPGGTFVNRQRVLPGQARPLGAGDLIQLGGVQLQVVDARKTAPVRPSTNSSEPFSYVIPGGPTCRTWDDLVTASAQRWEALRGELVSGRLAGFLASIGRPDLAPSPLADGSPDERLDAWLGSLPTTRDVRPELEVHPAQLTVRVAPGGGSVRRVIQISNVGHRLLRSTSRVEPPSTSWLTISPEFSAHPFLTVEGTELAFDVAIPETLPIPLTAEIVVEGNGGTKRVKVILEPKPATSDPIALDAEPVASSGLTLVELIARQSPMARLVSWALVALAARLLVGVAGGSIGEDGMTASGADAPGLGRVALALAAVGGVLGGLLAARRGGSKEAPSGAFAGACAGVIASTALVAACRSIEPALGPWSTSVVAVCASWALIGSALAAGSIADSPPDANAPAVVVTQPDESKFPEITVYYELRRPDGSFVLDAKRNEFRVTEDGQDRPILRFEAPQSTEVRPTTLILVVDRSASMEQEDKIGSLKRAVAAFLGGMPKGSRVAVISFCRQIEVICPFTTHYEEAIEAVDALEIGDGTAYYDAVARALDMLRDQSGRRAVLALTDGEDNASRRYSLAKVIALAKALNLPVHTLGFGNEREIAVEDLALLADETRGQHYLARDADQLRKIYEEIARRIGNSYSLAYQTDRKVPDGTLRPIRIVYQKGTQAQTGETAVFIRGMVVPQAGWSGLFLGLLGVLLILSRLPYLKV